MRKKKQDKVLDAKAEANRQKQRLAHDESDAVPIAEHHTVHKFTSKIRPGESFAKFCRRMGEEKRAVLVQHHGHQGLTKTSSKRKKYLQKQKDSKRGKSTVGNEDDDDEE